jgi:hypothetical protein
MALLSTLSDTFSFSADGDKVKKIFKAHKRDLTSEQTHEELKQANVDVHIKAGNKHFWSGYLSMFGNHLISSSFMAIGVAIGLTGGAGFAIAGMMVAGIALGAIAHSIHQNANRMTQSTNMDLSDANCQRIAMFNAKALKQELLSGKEAEIASEPEAKKEKAVVGKYTAAAVQDKPTVLEIR